MESNDRPKLSKIECDADFGKCHPQLEQCQDAFHILLKDMVFSPSHSFLGACLWLVTFEVSQPPHAEEGILESFPSSSYEPLLFLNSSDPDN